MNQEGLIKAGDWIVDILAEAQVKTSTYEDFVSNLRDAITMYEGMLLIRAVINIFSILIRETCSHWSKELC